MPTPKPIHILFLCTGNSARSILAESILNHRGEGLFRGFSAGSQPKGQVNPLALEILRQRGHDTGYLRSKSWNEFAAPGAPAMDMVVTVCGNAANEVCPAWPGQPLQVHWGFDDPSDAEGDASTRLQAFHHTFGLIEQRLQQLVALPVRELDRITLLNALRQMATCSKSELPCHP